MDNCAECENGDECITCDSNYVNINKKCFLQIENCKKYNDEGKCIRCELGYRVSGNGIGCESGIENCENFDSSSFTCNACETNYILYDNLCYKKIDNCEQYENEEFCKKCSEGYAFKVNDRLNCYDINQLTEYYTKDNSYFKCDDTSNNGINNCKNCEYVSKELICTTCKSDFILKDDETNICYSKEIFTNDKKYYYENEYLIISCSKKITNCETCTKNEDVSCDNCEDNYRLSNNKCFKIIDNCDNYDTTDGNLCQKCKDGYAFEGDEKKICKEINIFEEYYTKDNGISYYKCDDETKGGIPNCKKCEYNNNELKCNECSSEYIIKDDEYNKCYSKSTYNNDKKYYYDDEFHIKTCSQTIDNCDECEKIDENLNCEKCKTDYYIVNKINRSCNKLEEITPLDEYYFNDEINEYFFCGNKKYNIVENCKKCDGDTECKLCNDGYTFINKEKLMCKNIKELGNKYIMDESDNTIYKKCSEIMENCDTCSSKDECISCITEYGLYNDKKKCVNINEHYHYKNKIDNLFYLCNTKMKFCEKCSSENECIQCNEEYIKINNDKSTCIPNTDINITEYYLAPNDTNMYLKCSSLINNCISCNYEDGCKLCKNEFILLNDDTRNCIEKSKTSLDYFFTEDNHTYYSCKDSKYKSNIKCFSMLPKQNINLTFYQAQLINHKLICHMLTHSPIPKNFSLIFKIIIFSSRLRNLGDLEKNVTLTNTDDSNGESNSLISFTSDEEYDDSVSYIKIDDIQLDNENTVTKAVEENNICMIKFNKNSDLTNTQKVDSLIKEKKIPDCSLIQEEEVITLEMGKIDKCEFTLNSENQISFSDDNFDLYFIEYNNTENEINAECDTKNDNIQTINCKINDKIYKKFSLKEEIISLSDKLLIISTEKEYFKFNCKNGINLKTIIIIVGVIIVGIIFICICVCCCGCKNQKKSIKINKEHINRLPTNNQPYEQNEIYMYNQKNNSKSFRNSANSGIRLN